MDVRAPCPFSPFSSPGTWVGSHLDEHAGVFTHISFLPALHLDTFTLLPAALPSPPAQMGIPQRWGHPVSLRP